MRARLVNTLRWSYRKNRADLWGLVARQYPAFVLASSPQPLRSVVPVFVFHTLEPERFEAQLRLLQDNGYRTITCDALLRVMRGDAPPPENTVMLTVDDGTASLYTVGFPLLRRYGFQAVSFIVPGLIPDRKRGDAPLCSWAEITEMHETGVIDFQAHSTHHQRVGVSEQVVDFVHPAFDRAPFGNVHVPVYWTDGVPDYGRDAPLGTPVYHSEPRLSGRPQYFDPQTVRQACVAYVANHGGADFFAEPQWRAALRRFHAEQTRASGPGHWETVDEMHRALVADLRECKDRIEARLTHAAITHLAFPWFLGSDVAVRAAEAAGFTSLFWGFRAAAGMPGPGADPRYVSRLEDRYVWRLPGKGRRSLGALMRDKWATVRHTRNGAPADAAGSDR